MDLFVEKYRPKTIEDCILPTDLKNTFREMVKSKVAQNILLCGSAGTGKTSVARALCNDLNAEYILINCSEDRNIDTLRVKIRDFASTVSLNGHQKVVILDEFDYSNANSIQPALRGAIEEFANNCRFILTCNYKNRIIAPIHSRCTNIEFNIPSSEKPFLAKSIMDRIKFILNKESIPFEDVVLAKLIMKYFPDIRRMLNEIQRYSLSGQIDVGILSNFENIKIRDLVVAMKDKNFTDARKWIVSNLDNSPPEMFRKIYDTMYESLDKNSIPEAIIIIAEYQYKAAFVADQEINFVACVVELMMRCEFK
jgi:DNA polymerase III delta prime subunit|tara:strand:+ start:6555 stop:7484 length:930 start_codon:yes stop_codon:yes gene_type:complete